MALQLRGWRVRHVVERTHNGNSRQKSAGSSDAVVVVRSGALRPGLVRGNVRRQEHFDTSLGIEASCIIAHCWCVVVCVLVLCVCLRFMLSTVPRLVAIVYCMWYLIGESHDFVWVTVTPKEALTEDLSGRPVPGNFMLRRDAQGLISRSSMRVGSRIWYWLALSHSIHIHSSRKKRP